MSLFNIVNQNVRRNCALEVQGLPFGQHEVLIRPARRSNQANALYWKWIGIISDNKGFSADEMHDAFKRHFIGEQEKVNAFGQVVIVPKSSASLRKRDFTEYMNKIEAYAQGEGIILPSPDYYGYGVAPVEEKI